MLLPRSVSPVSYAHFVQFTAPIISVRRERDCVLVFTQESAYWIAGISGGIEIADQRLWIESLTPEAQVQPAITYTPPSPLIEHV
jgi:hypothetical protein